MYKRQEVQRVEHDQADDTQNRQIDRIKNPVRTAFPHTILSLLPQPDAGDSFGKLVDQNDDENVDHVIK